jgi:hypothetical protein
MTCSAASRHGAHGKPAPVERSAFILPRKSAASTPPVSCCPWAGYWRGRHSLRMATRMADPGWALHHQNQQDERGHRLKGRADEVGNTDALQLPGMRADGQAGGPREQLEPGQANGQRQRGAAGPMPTRHRAGPSSPPTPSRSRTGRIVRPWTRMVKSTMPKVSVRSTSRPRNDGGEA